MADRFYVTFRPVKKKGKHLGYQTGLALRSGNPHWHWLSKISQSAVDAMSFGLKVNMRYFRRFRGDHDE